MSTPPNSRTWPRMGFPRSSPEPSRLFRLRSGDAASQQRHGRHRTGTAARNFPRLMLPLSSFFMQIPPDCLVSVHRKRTVRWGRKSAGAFWPLCARTHQTESQAGERPCTEESAGKRRVTPVSRYRRRIWAQTDWAVKYHEKTYLPSQYRLLAGCQSRERGPGAMDHLMPEITYSNESTARVVKEIRKYGQ